MNQNRKRVNRENGMRGRVPAADAENTGVPSDEIDVSCRFGLDAVCLLVLDLQALTRCHKEGTVYQYVPLRPPIPVPPLQMVRVHALCHLGANSVIPLSEKIESNSIQRGKLSGRENNFKIGLIP